MNLLYCCFFLFQFHAKCVISIILGHFKITDIVTVYQLMDNYFSFRLPPKRTIPRTLTLSSARKRDGDQLWRHSREPIKQPLLKKLLNKEELCQEACFAFNDIL